jgi:hypothetical protein
VRNNTDRRATRRYELRLPLHYRVSSKGSMALSGTGTTREVSSCGLSFRCRRPLPIGSHIELTIEWPARYNEVKPMELVVTGIVSRSDGGRTAVRLTSKRFQIDSIPIERYRATA